MKTQLLKKDLSGILMVLLAIFSLLHLSGQETGEMLQGGGMGANDESLWTVEIVGRGDFENPTGDQIPNYEFGYSGECTYCDDGVLRVWAAGTGYVNIIFSQEVTLEAGATYKADAAFKCLSDTLINCWAQLKIGIEGNAPSHENEDIKLMGFNAWIPCGTGIDGTFANDACDWEGLNEGETPNLVGGRGFVAPDTLGDEFTAYFAIVVGMYTNGVDFYPYDIIIDEVSLVDSALATGGGTVELREFNNEASIVNYPNPFKQQTTIAYSIPERSRVKILVYNLLGEEIFTLVEGIKEPGEHITSFDGSNIKTNVLICKLEYNDKVITRKMTLIK